MEARLSEALARVRGRLGDETTCFRCIDDADLTVDVFGPVAIASFYRATTPNEPRSLAEAVVATGAATTVYVKHRPKEAKRAATIDASSLAPLTPELGPAVDELEVREARLRFLIRPANGLSVGLYLDARDARGWVRANSGGARVLNLFAYTCGFGVAARVGGAARAANVDASRKVLDWGAANLALNGVAPDRYDFISGDAFEWLERLAKKGERFELVVLDPPGFATTRSSRFTASRDYHRLVALAEPLIAKGGRLLSLCNVEALSAADFEAQVQRGLGARRWRRVTSFGASALDFQQPSALKCLVDELA